MRHRFALAIALGLVLSGSLAGRASAYSWPLEPFDHPHALRASFGDPRTVYAEEFGLAGLDGPGKFSFHNGVDIAASPGTPVYPVMSGRAQLLGSSSAVVVRSPDGHVFQYYHVLPAIFPGEQVMAGDTLLGWIADWSNHLHFAEISHGRVANPLQSGHLTPYGDTTAPEITSVEFRTPAGLELDPYSLHGRVDLIAEAHDTLSIRVPGLAAPRPVAPAALTWWVTTLAGELVVPLSRPVDFRASLPSNLDFWRVYARGTYQNLPSFGGHAQRDLVGRYRFRLAPRLFDTRQLENGGYVLHVAATDERGNRTAVTRRLTIQNAAS